MAELGVDVNLSSKGFILLRRPYTVYAINKFLEIQFGAIVQV